MMESEKYVKVKVVFSGGVYCGEKERKCPFEHRLAGFANYNCPLFLQELSIELAPTEYKGFKLRTTDCMKVFGQDPKYDVARELQNYADDITGGLRVEIGKKIDILKTEFDKEVKIVFGLIGKEDLMGD